MNNQGTEDKAVIFIRLIPNIFLNTCASIQEQVGQPLQPFENVLTLSESEMAQYICKYMYIWETVINLSSLQTCSNTKGQIITTFCMRTFGKS